MKNGYSIRTWKMRLFCPKPELLISTEVYFRQILDFYYDLLQKNERLWKEGLFQIQRELEVLTIAGRDGRQPLAPLPYEKVPVYFRRSAINKAAMAVKAAVSAEKFAGFPEKIESSVTFFKGMYRDLSDRGITLKLWDGNKWSWVPCVLKGRSFPEQCELLSPELVRQGKWNMLHIPVKQENSDIRTAKERMAAGERICSIRFTNTDIFAMCCILEDDGCMAAVHACCGGDAYRHYCRQLLDKIDKSRVYTDKDDSLEPNKKYFSHLKNLSEHYAHQVSREIVDFCIQQRSGIIILPIYNEVFSKMSLYKSGNFSPLHLSSRIRSFLKYKAWAEGILVLEVRAEGVGKTCAVCGGKVKQKGKMFQCENGHEGNRYLNAARNLGLRCQVSFLRNMKNSKTQEVDVYK